MDWNTVQLSLGPGSVSLHGLSYNRHLEIFQILWKMFAKFRKSCKYLLMNFLAYFGGRRPLSDPVSWLTGDGGLAPIVGALRHHLGVGRGDGGPAGQGGAGQVWSIPGVGLILFQCDKG